MAQPLLALTALLAMSLPPAPDPGGAGWRDEAGRPVAETAHQRSRNGFGGLLLVTPDLDWQAKWQTPPEVKPHFNTTRTVRRGQQIFLLTFLTNPQADGNGRVRVTCDLRLTRPDGTLSQDLPGLACFEGPRPDNPYYVLLAAPAIGFTSDDSDPPGTWRFEVVLHDTVRGTDLPLSTSFEVLPPTADAAVAP